MMKRKYRVSVVLDPSYGKRLFGLSQKNHVWVCSSRENMLAAKIINRGRKTISIESGVTTFECDDSISSESILMGIMSDIDLHHGEYSHEHPWNEIEVIGVGKSEVIEREMKKYGVVKCVETEEGFIAEK